MGRIKVMMVDDEVRFRETTAKILERKGFQTTVAGSGEEAVDILAREHQDVVVLDIRMPGMDGHAALEKIKEIDPKAQVIMLTGHGALDSARESLKHGAFDYLTKPCDIDRLASRINDAHRLAMTGKREEKSARDIMIPLEDYTTIGPDNLIREGIEALQASFYSLVSTSRLMQTGHRSILVMNGSGRLVGLLSIRDLMGGLRPGYLSSPKPSTADSMVYSQMFWRGLFTAQAGKLAGKKVSEVMSPAPPFIDEETNLMEVANLLYETECRRLAVTRDDRVVGVIREQEIFFELADLLLQSDSPQRYGRDGR